FFETIQKVEKLDDILGDVAATSAKYDFWRIDWVPETDKGLLWAAKRIPKAQANPNGDYPTDKAESVLGFLFNVWDKVSGAHGPLLDGTMAAVYKLMALVYNLEETKANGPLRNMLPVDRRVQLHVAMAEWSFAPRDLPAVLDLCRKYFAKAGWP